jgi:hypothetical protein
VLAAPAGLSQQFLALKALTLFHLVNFSSSLSSNSFPAQKTVEMLAAAAACPTTATITT